ncbi:nitroreductase family protein, partial [Niallia taxi]
MAEFLDIVKERRSASNFLEGNPITKEELNTIFEAVKLAPSAFNLQHTRYITVLDANMKEKIRAAAQGQYKVASASAVILVVGNKHAYKQAG